MDKQEKDLIPNRVISEENNHFLGKNGTACGKMKCNFLQSFEVEIIIIIIK